MKRIDPRSGWFGGAGPRVLAGLGSILVLCASASAGDIQVAFEGQSCCCVQGTFSAAVPESIAWQVLADYDGIGRFVPSVRSSRLERRPNGDLLVHQEAENGLFLVKRRMRVVLDIQEVRGRRIGFRDVLGKDFRRYEGEWRIASDSSGTRVEYQVDAEPRGGLARAMCRSLLRGSARDLLAQVRREMVRRASEVANVHPRP